MNLRNILLTIIFILSASGAYLAYRTYEHRDTINSLNKKVADLASIIETDKVNYQNIQTEFSKLKSAADECSTKVTLIQEKDKQLEQRIVDSNNKIDDYEKELQEQATKIAAQVLPNDCPSALQVLVNNAKTNAGKLKIKREIHE